jgi:Mrp family chromosome partitioning ATPase
VPSFHLASTFSQRCVYPLAGLLLLLAVTPFVHTPRGAALANVLNAIVVVSAVLAAGRSRRALAIAAALAGVLYVAILIARLAGSYSPTEVER